MIKFFIFVILLLILIKIINKKNKLIEKLYNNKKIICIHGNYNHFKSSRLNLLNNKYNFVFKKLDKNNLDTCEKIILWEPFEKYPLPDYTKNKKKIINKDLKNISKKYLEKYNKDIFGYNLEINPLIYNKPFVEKNQGNILSGRETNKHNKEYIYHNKPIKKINNNKIYQKIINNKENDIIYDYRIMVFKREIYLLIKFSVDKQFWGRSGDSKNIKIYYKNNLLKEFTKKDIENIKKFINFINLDYGEIDIIKDYDTKNIHIIDVNNTPHCSKDYFSHTKINEINYINQINKL